jgi:RNA polymerase sigma-70 factor, ECF subfamily
LDALGHATSGLDVKQRNVLRLHYADGLNIDDIGALYGVHRATVARWLQNARSTIDSAVHKELADRHGLSDSDVTSLIHGARGQLEENLRRLLSKPASTDSELIDEAPDE